MIKLSDKGASDKDKSGTTDKDKFTTSDKDKSRATDKDKDKSTTSAKNFLYNRSFSFHPSFRLMPITGRIRNEKKRGFDDKTDGDEKGEMTKKKHEKESVFPLSKEQLSSISTDSWLPEQNRALELLSQGKNIFITGGPGTRKTDTIIKLRNAMNLFGVKNVLLCSTIDNAIKLNCSTLIDWFNVPSIDVPELKLIRAAKKEVEKWTCPSVYFIDNVTLLEPRYLEMLNKILCGLKGNSLPFGGVTMVVSGDMALVPNMDIKLMQKIFFEYDHWTKANFETIYLHKNYRFDIDVELTTLLEHIRTGCVTEDDKKILVGQINKVATIKPYSEFNTMILPHQDITFNPIFYPPHLHSFTVKAASENEKKMIIIQANADKRFTLRARYNKCLSSDPEVKQRSDLFLHRMKTSHAKESIILFTGAQVMLLTDLNIEDEKDGESKRCDGNLASTSTLIKKGSIGVVIGWSEEVAMSSDAPLQRHPKVVFRPSTKIVTVKPFKWEDYSTRTEYWQIPLTLGWSISTHGSSELMLDGALINTKYITDSRQFYNCLCRIRSIEGISLQSFDESWLTLDPKIVEKYRDCASASASASASSSCKKIEISK